VNKFNLIVVGGGISGVAAAVCAARRGLSVLLIEKTGCLGGAISNNLVYPFMKHALTENKRLLSDGIFTEMKKRRDEYGDTSWESFKFVFDDMISEAGVEVLFHTTVCGAETDGRNVKSVKAFTKSGVMEFEADYFIDATGDGELIFMTGCDYQLGRESDGFCQPMTTCFRVGNVDIEQFKLDKPMLQESYKKLRENGEITNPREDILTFLGLGDGIVHFNTTRVVKLDPVDPFAVSKAEILARRQIPEMMKFLKSHSKAFDNSTIISIATHIGVRESRKLKGVHILTADELKGCVEFEDTIALGNYKIDIHNPLGSGTEFYHFKEGEFYKIPYRSLLPKEYDNMLVAGRCLSAEHAAHSAVRIMPICACMGEAAGVACAVAREAGANLQNVDIKTLRAELIKNGAAI